jgi:hypothetical protein
MRSEDIIDLSFDGRSLVPGTPPPIAPPLLLCQEKSDTETVAPTGSGYQPASTSFLEGATAIIIRMLSYPRLNAGDVRAVTRIFNVFKSTMKGNIMFGYFLRQAASKISSK